MIALTAEDIIDLRRWFLSAAVVVLAYGAVAAAMVRWTVDFEPALPAAAIVVTFGPQVAAPSQEQTSLPPGPEQ